MKKVNLTSDKKEFLQRLKAIDREGISKLAKYLLKSDFFTAPASVRNHLSEPGGLCRHSLNVADALKDLLFTEGSMWNQYAKDRNITEETCEVVGLLHDLCKTNFYIEGYKNKKNYDPDDVAAAQKAGETIKKDTRGQFFWQEVSSYEIEDKFPIGHGEKSLCMALQFISLSKDEQLALRWHMGFSVPKEEWPALNAAMDLCPLVIAVHMADITATHLMETENCGYETSSEEKEEPEQEAPEDEQTVDESPDKEEEMKSAKPKDKENTNPALKKNAGLDDLAQLFDGDMLDEF